MDLLLQVLDELDDAAGALAHAALATETRLAGLVGWATGAAVFAVAAVGVAVGLNL
jgi:hypothetical protein